MSDVEWIVIQPRLVGKLMARDRRQAEAIAQRLYGDDATVQSRASHEIELAERETRARGRQRERDHA